MNDFEIDTKTMSILSLDVNAHRRCQGLNNPLFVISYAVVYLLICLINHV